MALSEEEIYQEHVLDHYEDPYHRGRLEHPTHRHEDDNPLCGDVIQVELVIDPDGMIKEAYFDGDGCCISQASASMLMERIDGKSIDDIKHLTAADMLELFGAKLTPNRQKCCLLPWRVLQSAVFSPLEDSDGEAGSTQGPVSPNLTEKG
jgi:nitrogen fixation NifU-like protein